MKVWGFKNRTACATFRRTAMNTAAITFTALAAAACIHNDQGTMVAGWAITDPTQRHPIMVTAHPETISFRVPRGSYGLTPQQRAQLTAFAERQLPRDSRNGKIVIHAPTGSGNEVDSMQAVGEIREYLIEAGFDAPSVALETYHDRGHQPPIRVSYVRYTAEAPECGYWGSNLAEDPLNVGVPNLGCATQANFAAMVSNPADLLGPRNETARSSERRDVVWQKYIKGDSTVAKKSEDERAKVDIGK